jgi:hypothetical protein
MGSRAAEGEAPLGPSALLWIRVWPANARLLIGFPGNEERYSSTRSRVAAGEVLSVPSVSFAIFDTLAKGWLRCVGFVLWDWAAVQPCSQPVER